MNGLLKMSLRTKIFVSISKAADSLEINRVLTYLQKYNCEVVTFAGGPYSHAQMLSCDELIFIPPSPINTQYKNVNVGKGQFEQFVEWDKKKHTTPLVVCAQQKVEDLHLSEISCAAPNSEANWKTDYAIFITHSLKQASLIFKKALEFSGIDFSLDVFDFLPPLFVPEKVRPMLACSKKQR